MHLTKITGSAPNLTNAHLIKEVHSLSIHHSFQLLSSGMHSNAPPASRNLYQKVLISPAIAIPDITNWTLQLQCHFQCVCLNISLLIESKATVTLSNKHIFTFFSLVHLRYKPPSTETNPTLEDPTPDYMNLLGMIFSMCGLMLKVSRPPYICTTDLVDSLSKSNPSSVHLLDFCTWCSLWLTNTVFHMV